MELAQAALLIGKEAEGAELLARAHQGFMSPRATHSPQCVVPFGSVLLHSSMARWQRREAGSLEPLVCRRVSCVRGAWLSFAADWIPADFREGSAVTAQAAFEQATAIGERFGDKDLVRSGCRGRAAA